MQNLWEANHIGSFIQPKTISKEHYLATSLRILHGLHENRIYYLKCTIILDRKKCHVLVQDSVTNEILETFKFVNVINVTNHETNDISDKFHNILCISTKDLQTSPDTMKEEEIFESHLFILDENVIRSQLVADVIRSNIDSSQSEGAGKNSPIHSSNKSTASNEHSQLQQQQQQQQPANSAVSSKPPENPATVGNTNDEANTKMERQMLLLNYCLDDIEVFLQRLVDQKNAIEQFQIRQSVRLKKSKMLGDGFLLARSAPSSIESYVDCIQKIKLCFNLLGQLRGKIDRPTAEEMVQSHVFQPLLEVINSLRAQHHREASEIVKDPLLCNATIQLVRASLNEKQSYFWLSLGEYWTKPSESWPKYQEVYYPKFFNGYRPDPNDLKFRDMEIVQKPLENPIHENPTSSTTSTSSSAGNAKLNKVAQVPGTNATVSSLFPSMNSRVRNFCLEILNRGGKIYSVMENKSASNSKELSITQGELVEVLNSDRNWWKLRNMYSEEGHCPFNILKPFEWADQLEAANGATNKTSQQQNGLPSFPVAPHPPQNQSPNRPPEKRSVSTADSPANKQKISTHSTSAVEEKKPLKQLQAELLASELRDKINGKYSPNSAASNSSNNNHNAPSMFPPKHRPMPITGLGSHAINQDSNAEDVQMWLRFKGFSSEVQSRLLGYQGKDILLLAPFKIRQVIPSSELARFESQIKIQRSLCGFGTLSNRELNAILRRRKEQTDNATSTRPAGMTETDF